MSRTLHFSSSGYFSQKVSSARGAPPVATYASKGKKGSGRRDVIQAIETPRHAWSDAWPSLPPPRPPFPPHLYHDALLEENGRQEDEKDVVQEGQAQ